jgi:phage shock protein A
MLDTQADAAGADAARQDIERTRQWLDNANVLLAKGNEGAAAKYLNRVKVSLDLIAALVQAGNIQKAADDQEEAYYKAKETQIPELEADIQELQDQKKELGQALNKLR